MTGWIEPSAHLIDFENASNWELEVLAARAVTACMAHRPPFRGAIKMAAGLEPWGSDGLELAMEDLGRLLHGHTAFRR